MRSAYLAILVLSLPACAQRPTATMSCGTSWELTGNGIGEFRIGRLVTELRSSCDVVADTTLAFGNEGQPERRIAIRVASDTLEATVVEGRVWRIEVDAPAFRTSDSLGVGSTAAQLRKRGARRPGYGEGGIYTTIPTLCGLSFRIAAETHPVAIERGWAALPDSAPVDEVLIVGCR